MGSKVVRQTLRLSKVGIAVPLLALALYAGGRATPAAAAASPAAAGWAQAAMPVAPAPILNDWDDRRCDGDHDRDDWGCRFRRCDGDRDLDDALCRWRPW